jgi:hypothetical protein
MQVLTKERTAHEVAATVPLSKPLSTHQGDTTQIILRKPNFGEFIEIGQIENLVYTNSDGGTRQMHSDIDFERLMRWACKLSGLDRIILSSLDAQDGYALSKAVVEIVNVFVVGGLQKPQTNSSSSAA